MQIEPLEVRQLLSVTVLDNQDAAYVESGANWQSANDTDAYQDNFRCHSQGTGQNRASWTCDGLDPDKQYQVFVTWPAGTDRATNSPFTIFDDNSALATVQLNQQTAPADVRIAGQAWESVGVYDATSGTLVVQLSDNANGKVIADAVRVVEVSARNGSPAVRSLRVGPDPVIEGATLHLEASGVTALGQVTAVTFWRDADHDGTFDPAQDQWLGTDAQGSDGWTLSVSSAGFGRGDQRYFAQAVNSRNIAGRVATTTGTVGLAAVLDDRGLGYSETGQGWTSRTAAVDVGGEHRQHAAGSGEAKAQWSFEGVPDGYYRVCISWSAAAGQASNAPFSIYDGTELVGQVAVDQRVAPSGFEAEGRTWLELGLFPVSHGAVTVELSNAADGIVAADAVYLIDPPYIGSLMADSSPVNQGVNFTLTAGVSGDAAVTSVTFYRDTNQNYYLDTSDEPVGNGSLSYGSNYNGQWSAPIDTSGVYGSQIYLAEAIDENSCHSNVPGASVYVNMRPVATLDVSSTLMNPGDTLTLSAANSYDDGYVVSISFYVGGQCVGTDSDGSDGWSATADTTYLSGQVTCSAVATDNTSLVGLPTNRSVTVRPRPTIGSMSISSNSSPVNLDDTIILTANNVSPSGTVSSVSFYRDSNHNLNQSGQLLDSADACVGTDYTGSDGWSVEITASSAGWQDYYAVATGSNGLNSLTASTGLRVHAPPSIGSLSAPSEVIQGGYLTLTASSVFTPNGFSGIVFYRENNSTTGLNAGDEQLSGSLSSESTSYDYTNYSLTVNTSTWSGAQTFYARVTDSDNCTATVSTTATVYLPPTVGSLSAPSAVGEGESFTLTAENVGGSVTGVSFYRDTNSNGILDEWWDEYGFHRYGDEYVGSGSSGSNGWSMTAGTSSLSLGSYTYFAVAAGHCDTLSSVASTSVTIGSRPWIGYLWPSQSSVEEGCSFGLTAYNVSGGGVFSFYRETDNVSGLDPNSDECVGTSQYSSIAAIGTTGLGGTQTYYVIVTNSLGLTSAPVSTTVTIEPKTTVQNVSATTVWGWYTAGDEIDITVAFIRAVTVTGTPQLQLATGSSTARYASYLSGSGTSTLTFAYVVQMGDNTERLDYASADALELNGGTIQDAASFDCILTLSSPRASRSLWMNTQLDLDTRLYWDANGIENGTGGNGVWDRDSEHWRLGSSSGTLQAWTDGADVMFSGTSGTVTIPDATTIHAASITIEEGYTIASQTSSSLLSLASGGTKVITVSGSTTISAKFTGSNGLTKAGTGTLTLSSATSDYTGPTTISGGTLVAAGGSAIPNQSAVVLANVAGATLSLSGNETIGSLTGGGTSGGNVSLGSNMLTVGANSTSTTFAGVISGTGGLTKTGTGTLTLSGTNTQTGGTVLSGGTLQLGNPANNPTLGDARGTLVIYTGELDLNGKSATVGYLTGAGVITDNSFGSSTSWLTVNFAGTYSFYSGQIRDGSNDHKVGFKVTGSGWCALQGHNTYTGGTQIDSGVELDVGRWSAGSIQGDVTNNGALWFMSSENIVISGEISGSGSLYQIGSGTLTLDHSNTHTGGTLIGGGSTVQLGDPAHHPTLGDARGSLCVDGTLDLNGNSATVGYLAGLGVITDNSIGSSTTWLTVNYVGAYSVYSGQIRDGSNQKMGFKVTGSGWCALQGDNTYTGGTQIDSGRRIGCGSQQQPGKHPGERVQQWTVVVLYL